MGRHPEEHELALYISRDLSAWRNFAVGRHLAGCPACRREVALLADASSAFSAEVNLVPGGPEGWGRLAAEMRANIRLGLEAGECVPGGESDPLFDEPAQPAGWYSGWNPARWWNSSRLGAWLAVDAAWLRAVSLVAAVALVSTGIWWWQRDASGSTLAAYFSSDPAVVAAPDNSAAPENGGDLLFRTVADGLMVERSGRSLTLAHTGRAATALTVSSTGSMTAEYVDDDSGQVTIHNVYAE